MASWIGTDVVHGGSVDGKPLAGRPRLRCVTRLVALAGGDLLEAEVARDLFTGGWNMSRPPSHTCAWSSPFALLDDLSQCSQAGPEAVDGNDAAAAAVVELVRDLSPGIAAEHS
jgi:hypothetical protein